MQGAQGFVHVVSAPIFRVGPWAWAGAAVSIAGPIGFVGLLVPHALRLIVGPDYRLLLPASALAGAAFLVAMDTIARLMLQPAELQVGIITALLGAPFFLYLLYRNRRLMRTL